MDDDDLISRACVLFQQALELCGEEREAFLAAKTIVDSDAVSAAREMIRRFEADPEPEVGTAVALPEWARDREGTRVGDWLVGRRLGAGGFGTVYQATRTIPGGELMAAIKFLDMAPHQVERFRRERQTLADLNHEGICKFLDAGETEGGVPFMVMEFVSGLPITVHCDYYRLTITERLKLFVKLCQAIEYAHRERVLHRDLKPANVLVTANAAVCVLDFGVARMIGPGSGAPALTKRGESPWSKACASPEQLRGGRLTFGTDVYGLGVLLYELISGQLPYSEFALRSKDWVDVVCKRDPLPPSQALLIETTDDSGGSRRPPETAARDRKVTPSALKRTLAGNLDAVTLKALAKNTDDRYRQVGRLREDIERFLEGLPVTARASSWWERMVTWSSRHRVTAALTLGCAAWSVVVVNLGQARDLRNGDTLRRERAVIRRLAYLAEAGLPRIERTLPYTAESQDAHVRLAQIHTRLLARMAALPPYTLSRLDRSIAASSLECAQAWRDLGQFATALSVTGPVLPQVARRYGAEPRDRDWRDIYLKMLRQRMELYGLMKAEAERAALAETLAEVEGRRF